MLIPLLEIVPSLQSLSLGLLLPGIEWQQHLFETILQHNRKLRHVCLERAGRTHVNYLWHIDMALTLASLPQLQSLSLTPIDTLSDRPFMVFGQLRQLEMSLQEFTRGELGRLVSLLPSNLESFSLSECHGVPRNLPAILSDHLPNLVILSLANVDFYDHPTMLHQVNWASKMTRLRYFAASYASIPPVELVYFQSPLARVVLSNFGTSLTPEWIALLLLRWKGIDLESRVTVHHDEEVDLFSDAEKLMMFVRIHSFACLNIGLIMI